LYEPAFTEDYVGFSFLHHLYLFDSVLRSRVKKSLLRPLLYLRGSSLIRPSLLMMRMGTPLMLHLSLMSVYSLHFFSVLIVASFPVCCLC
jgi:hypothetical protein